MTPKKDATNRKRQYAETRKPREPRGSCASFTAVNEIHDKRMANPNGYITRIVSKEELDRL